MIHQLKYKQTKYSNYIKIISLLLFKSSYLITSKQTATTSNGSSNPFFLGGVILSIT